MPSASGLSDLLLRGKCPSTQYARTCSEMSSTQPLAMPAWTLRAIHTSASRSIGAGARAGCSASMLPTYHATYRPACGAEIEPSIKATLAAKEVAEWVEAQNKVTFAYLESIPEREAIKKRITELMDFEKYTSPLLPAPVKAGGKYFFAKNSGLQNQFVIYVQDTPDAEPRQLLDPNAWAKDGTAALSGLSPSDDGKLLAYGVAQSGSDWQTWKVVEVATGKPAIRGKPFGKYQ